MKDLTVSLEDRPGTLADLGEALGKAGINIEGMCGVASDGRSIIHVLVADAAAARMALEGAGIAVGVMSEILVGSITEASESIGLSPFFVSIIVVAIVGNAAEHWVAVFFAMKDKMDLSVNIAIGSSAQIALFVAPALVLISLFVGPYPMSLVFNGLELGAIFLAVLSFNLVGDGLRDAFDPSLRE